MNIPNFLTFLRIGLLPIFVFCYVKFGPTYQFLLALFFALICATDYVDGYIARTYNQVSDLGRWLDPVADKILLFGTLGVLVWADKIWPFWASLLIFREVFISYVRRSAHCRGFAIEVSDWGKWKSTMQYFYLGSVIGYPWPFLPDFLQQTLIGIFLTSALLLSYGSALAYYREYQKQIDA